MERSTHFRAFSSGEMSPFFENIFLKCSPISKFSVCPQNADVL